MLNPPLVPGTNPVTAFKETLGVHVIASVDRTPVAAEEFVVPALTAWQAPAEMEVVASANVPLDIAP
jgi:hypothetical protein